VPKICEKTVQTYNNSTSIASQMYHEIATVIVIVFTLSVPLGCQLMFMSLAKASLTHL
jgi:hypothetical protein